MPSRFLDIPQTEWVASNALAFAVRDRPGAGPGHTLVVSRREVPSYFDATDAEKGALWALVEEVKASLDRDLQPEGYNVGFSAGLVAGQTTLHLHVHVIPRFTGGADYPRSDRPPVTADRVSQPHKRPSPLATGGRTDPFGRHLWPLFATAKEIAIVAAFVTESGLEVLEPNVFSALHGGARVRLVTGDYLAFTQVSALRELLAWSQMDHRAEGASSPESPRLEVRIVETTRPDGSECAFHPKSWRFEGPDSQVAFVGSSNLSRSALETGIEWNLRVDRTINPGAYDAVTKAFESLWAAAIDLSAAWIDDYERRVLANPRPPPSGDADVEDPAPPPEPHEFQEEALAALAAARTQGRRRALVVLATGLGKTWLAAFDLGRVARETGKWPRVLFLAHREELLTQAARTFRRLLLSHGQPANIGWCAGDLLELEAPVVVASVQKLSRHENLDRLLGKAFDYVVVDEVHHASAPTYRRVLDHLDPAFLIGLTATPDRADEGDILGLFDDFVAYRADLGAGITRGRLVPFSYIGLRDDVDYAQIPWRNRSFDPAALAAAVQNQRRMDRLWEGWANHPGSRTLVFCCSIEHARFVRGETEGRRLVAADGNGTITIWESKDHDAWSRTQTIATDKPIPGYRVGRPVSVAVTPDGKTLAVCSALATSISIWDIAEGTPAGRLSVPGREQLTCLAMSPDGKRLAAGYRGPDGHGALIWDFTAHQVNGHDPTRAGADPRHRVQPGRALARLCLLGRGRPLRRGRLPAPALLARRHPLRGRVSARTTRSWPSRPRSSAPCDSGTSPSIARSPCWTARERTAS